MAVVLGATQTPFPTMVAYPILITNKERGVVDKIIRIPQTGQYAKYANNLAMSFCNVIIALTTHTILRALLQCKLFLPLHINLKIQISILIPELHIISLMISPT